MRRCSVVFPGQEQAELIDEPMPIPGPEDLLVESHASLISTGTESRIYHRDFTPGSATDRWVKYPFRSGYAHAGVVVQVGEKALGWKTGDRIATRAAHSSHVVVPASRAVRVPDGVSLEDAAWMAIGKITQIGVRAAEHGLGDTVAVVGLGILGQLVVQYVRLSGAREVIAIDTSELRLTLAHTSGATCCLRMPMAEAVQPISTFTCGRLADVAYDVTGHPATLSAMLPIVRSHGKAVLLGIPGHEEDQRLGIELIRRGIRLVGAHDNHASDDHGPDTKYDRTMVETLFLHYLARGQLRMDHLVTHRYKPEQASQAYASLRQQRHLMMGVMFMWR